MLHGERFNAITHIVGSVLALIGTAVVVTLASERGGARRITAVAVYGGMLVLLYLSSTLYHSLHGRAKRVFHVFDHCAIYLLIAGTYTPFTLVTLRGSWGWWLFAIVWSIAVAGVVKDVVFHGRYRALSVMLYVAMGWLVVVAFNPLTRALPRPGIALLFAGGIVYTIGVFFFAMSKRIPYSHGVWHLFVLAGSALHYLAVVLYVAIP
ncbi:MAG TPA: hemolysin III family protein [Thermoanaerobaculia bacterium]